MKLEHTVTLTFKSKEDVNFILSIISWARPPMMRWFGVGSPTFKRVVEWEDKFRAASRGFS